MTTYIFNVSLQSSVRLEFFTTHAAGLVVHVWAKDLVHHMLVD